MSKWGSESVDGEAEGKLEAGKIVGWKAVVVVLVDSVQATEVEIICSPPVVVTWGKKKDGWLAVLCINL